MDASEKENSAKQYGVPPFFLPVSDLLSPSLRSLSPEAGHEMLVESNSTAKRFVTLA